MCWPSSPSPEGAGARRRSLRGGAAGTGSRALPSLAELPKQEAVDVGLLEVALLRRAAHAMAGLAVQANFVNRACQLLM